MAEFRLGVEDIEAIAEAVARRLQPAAPVSGPDMSGLVTREAFARMVQLDPRTISKRFDEGALHGRRIGRRIYIYKNQ